MFLLQFELFWVSWWVTDWDRSLHIGILLIGILPCFSRRRIHLCTLVPGYSIYHGKGNFIIVFLSCSLYAIRCIMLYKDIREVHCASSSSHEFSLWESWRVVSNLLFLFFNISIILPLFFILYFSYFTFHTFLLILFARAQKVSKKAHQKQYSSIQTTMYILDTSPPCISYRVPVDVYMYFL